MPGPAKILVVDDEPDLALLIRQVFRKAIQAGDYAFAFAGDGQEALAALEADSEISLVLTDLNMPRMDGLTLLARLQETDRRLRVVVVSAYSDLVNIRAAMNRGAYDFVTKPIDRHDLAATIEKTWQEVVASRAAADARAQLAATQHELEVARQVQALKARFFADLSHEFRTPLTLLLGPVQDALDGAFGQKGHLPAAHLPVMHRHALRLKRLIDQLLDLSKLEAGRMTLRAGPHDVVPFLEDLVLSFAPAAERKQITLRFTPALGAAVLYFEPDKLEKVFANLLSNALKFTPEGGSVRVAVRAQGDADVEVEVRDSGPGIPAEALPHLFDRFYQFDPARAAEPGTGIGLALAKELVVLHGGTIAVASEEGFGAAFTVRLRRGRAHLRGEDLAGEAVPMHAGKGHGTHEEAGQDWHEEEVDDLGDDAADVPPPASAPTVLVVEDHPDVRAYVRRHLARRYHVLEAEDGAEGLAVARQARPDLVVSDVMMPGLDGYALCRALKEDEALNHVPVILLTARAEAEDTLEGLAHGADDYLTKPFNARELLLRAENLIEVRRLLRDRFSGEVVLRPAGVAVPSADAAFLERVQAYVEAHMGERGFDLEAVAEAVGLSARQLRRRVRDITGLSPSGFVRTLRLQRAAQLLEKEAGNISEIAYQVGFDDAKYFSRLFRQVYGVVPSAYGGRSGQAG
jgi:signal transduction histidine kinase/AraC-like DNA-binding protein